MTNGFAPPLACGDRTAVSAGMQATARRLPPQCKIYVSATGVCAGLRAVIRQIWVYYCFADEAALKKCCLKHDSRSEPEQKNVVLCRVQERVRNILYRRG